MSKQAPFQYPPSLQKYMITEAEFFAQNPAYNKLVSGAVIFDDKGRLLLVQRAKTDTFPNCHVRFPLTCNGDPFPLTSAGDPRRRGRLDR